MKGKLDVLGIRIDYCDVETAMEYVIGFLSKKSLMTVGLITADSLMKAQESSVHREYLENLDLSMPGETEVLEAAGIREGQVYEETGNNAFISRMFWQLIRLEQTFFLLGESKEELKALTTYIRDTYPEIQIVGRQYTENSDETVSTDWVVNEINGSGADIIVSDLKGYSGENFLRDNRMNINGKVWISLGARRDIQNEAGLKTGWFRTLLQKNLFKKTAAHFRDEEND